MNVIISWLNLYGINLALYLILILSSVYVVYLIVGSQVKFKLNNWKYAYRLRKEQNTRIKEMEYRSRFMRHISMLLKVTSKKESYTELSVFLFFFISIALFVLTFVVLIFNMKDVILSSFISLFACITPYLLLQVKLKNIRNDAGNELLAVVQSLTQNYNANNYDMYRALLSMTKDIENKTLRHVFYNLISDMQVARTEKEVRNSIDLFIYTCGNSWSKRLGNIILKAYHYDERVMNSLINLSTQMENTESMLEEEKSGALEPIMNAYFSVPIFISSIALGYYVTGPQDWVNLQFGYPFSTFTFAFSLALTIVSVLIALLLRNPKNDI